MLDEISMRVDEFNKKNPNVEFDYKDMIELQCVIDTVDGQKLSFSELETFVDRLPAKDSLTIQNAVNKVNNMVGIDTKIEFKCSRCGGEVLSYFRIGPEFYRPTL